MSKRSLQNIQKKAAEDRSIIKSYMLCNELMSVIATYIEYRTGLEGDELCKELDKIPVALFLSVEELENEIIKTYANEIIKKAING